MKKISIVCLIFLMVASISAVYQEENSMLDLGHSMRIKGVRTIPEIIAPGDEGILMVEVVNNGRYNVNDFRMKLILPPSIKPYNDVNIVNIARINSQESNEVNFRIVVSPSASEGIYSAELITDYKSNVGAGFLNVAEEQQDNYSLGIVVKSEPQIFVEVEDSNIYIGKNLGEVTIKFVNNNLADIKFLTVELQESEDYKTISSAKKYIGDLDSDDYESVEFRLKTKTKENEIKLPLKLTYKDSMNMDYSDTLEATLQVRTQEELGIKKNNSINYIILAVIAIVAGYFVYKRFRKRRHRVS